MLQVIYTFSDMSYIFFNTSLRG